MRILIPNFAAPDSFVDNVAYTLRGFGHTVVTAPHPLVPTGRIRRNLHDLAARARRNVESPMEQFARRTARDVGRFDMVLCLTVALRAETLDELRSGGIAHCVAWWGDPPANMTGFGLLADGWSRIYLKDAAAVRKFRAVGLPAALLHEACNPAWHRPVQAENRTPGDGVVVAGSYYGYRQMLVGRLLDAGVPLDLYGFSPPRWSDRRVAEAHRGEYIVRDRKSAVFGEALACLNCTTLAEGDSLNCRAFEIAGAGGLQLIEDKPSVASCFEPGSEVLGYACVAEIVDHLDRARRDRGWARAIRQAGQRRAHAEHTYEHRLATIFSDLGLKLHAD